MRRERRATDMVVAYVMCEDMSHDTFWLEVGDNTKLKVFPSHAKLPQKEWSPAWGELPGTKGACSFEVKESKAMVLKISAKETGMKIDRLVFKRVKPGT